MKKKIFSILLTVTMLGSMLSFFSLSAGALPEWDYVSPGDFIDFPSYTCYFEVILTGFTRGTTYNIPLHISHYGHILVQSYGSGGAYAPAMTLLNYNGTEIIREDDYAGRGFKNKGYRNQTLFQFFGGGSYILQIKPSTSENMRISFTFAENYFETVTPVSTFEDIHYMEDGTLSCDWLPGTSAVVGRYTPEATDFHTVITQGSPTMQSYIIDPSSGELLDFTSIPGEVTVDLYLNSSTTYYVIMFIPENPLPPDPTTLYLSIGRSSL